MKKLNGIPIILAVFLLAFANIAEARASRTKISGPMVIEDSTLGGCTQGPGTTDPKVFIAYWETPEGRADRKNRYASMGRPDWYEKFYANLHKVATERTPYGKPVYFYGQCRGEKQSIMADPVIFKKSPGFTGPLYEEVWVVELEPGVKEYFRKKCSNGYLRFLSTPVVEKMRESVIHVSQSQSMTSITNVNINESSKVGYVIGGGAAALGGALLGLRDTDNNPPPTTQPPALVCTMATLTLNPTNPTVGGQVDGSFSGPVSGGNVGGQSFTGTSFRYTPTAAGTVAVNYTLNNGTSSLSCSTSFTVATSGPIGGQCPAVNSWGYNPAPVLAGEPRPGFVTYNFGDVLTNVPAGVAMAGYKIARIWNPTNDPRWGRHGEQVGDSFKLKDPMTFAKGPEIEVETKAYCPSNPDNNVIVKVRFISGEPVSNTSNLKTTSDAVKAEKVKPPFVRTVDVQLVSVMFGKDDSKVTGNVAVGASLFVRHDEGKTETTAKPFLTVDLNTWFIRNQSYSLGATAHVQSWGKRTDVGVGIAANKDLGSGLVKRASGAVRLTRANILKDIDAMYKYGTADNGRAENGVSLSAGIEFQKKNDRSRWSPFGAGVEMTHVGGSMAVIAKIGFGAGR